MVFPFSLRFNKRLKISITQDNEQQILQYIMNCILDDKADYVLIDNKQVTYKGSTSNWRGSLFGSVDDGVFNLIDRDSYWQLNYQINMRNLFIITAILSIAMGLFALANGGPWWIAIAAFLWLCGMNWVINLIRHDAVANTIADGIDELIGDQTILTEENRMA